jgi:hypothetical protein
MWRETYFAGSFYVVFLCFFGVVVDCGFYDVVGPRKFGDFGSRGGKSATGECRCKADNSRPRPEQFLYYLPGNKLYLQHQL